MPVSHVCLGCGRDLARIRAGPDPHYGLPVVVCPGCGWACVRRRHPIPARWRQVRRVAWVLFALFWLTAGSMALLGLGIAASVALVPMLLDLVLQRGPLRPHEIEPARVFLAVAVVLIAAALSGLWLGAVLGHVRLRKLVVGSGAILLGLISIQWVLWGIAAAYAGITGVRPELSAPDTPTWGRRVLGAVVFVALTGLAAAVVRWGWDPTRPAASKAWRRRYNRSRERRVRA